MKAEVDAQRHDLEPPSGWARVKFGEIYELAYGKSLTKASRNTDGDFPVYGSNGIVGHHDTFLVEGPVLVVGRKGAAGAVSFSAKPCWPIDTTYYVRDSEHLDIRFSFYLLTSLRLNQFDRSTAIPGLNRDDAYDLVVDLPPLSEQRRIVAKIEELFSELDKGIESLKTAQAQLKVYRQAVLKHAFEGKLTAQWREIHSAIPWTQTTLGSQLSFLTSGSRGWAKFYAKHGDKFIRAQNLKNDQLDLADIAFVDLPDKSEGMRTRVQIGDLLIIITGANVTKTAFVTSYIGTAYVSQHVALARPVEGSNTEFLYWYLISEAAGRKQLTASAYGAGKPGLNLENIRSVKIPLPSAEEQTEIVSQINTILSIERSVSAQIDIQLARSEALRQSILKKAFSGQLVPQDPHDEPASVLLDRIRAEREQAAKNNRAKQTRKKKTIA